MTMTPSLLPVTCAVDILSQYRQTPIGLLLEYQNLNRLFDSWATAQLLIGMCMDNRKMLRVPDNFAYILRAGGANLRRSEFKVSFAIAIGGVRALALIAHDQCGMVGLTQRRDAFIHGLVAHAGWTAADAARHFDERAPDFEVADAAGFVCAEAQRLRKYYPKLLVAPLFYRVDEGKLYQLQES
jgi:carbonic anhydrase